MASIPTEFLACFTRIKLAEMVAPTLSALQLLDVNEAYLRLEDSLRKLELISGLQEAIWTACRSRRPKLDDEKLTELVEKKAAKKKAYTPLPRTKREEGPMAAFTLLVDEAAGFTAGDAFDLLESEAGAKMLNRGFALIGDHLAKQLVG
jgi:hypothetical protein